MADTPSDRPAVAREPDSAAQPEALAAPAPTTAPPARTASSAQQRQQGSTASTDREAAGGGTPSHAHAAPDLAAVEPAETGEFGALEVDCGSESLDDVADGADGLYDDHHDGGESVTTMSSDKPYDPQTDTDRDSAFDDDYESFTTSINSSATAYKYENGRRYHAYREEKYALPNDNEEINRLELQHRVWQLSLSGRLSLAPIPSTIRSALDIGCGTGAWVIDFAEEHPSTRVIGADLSPIQPTMVPPNVEFIVDDITSPWVYDHKFDYIHSRAITVGIRDWAALVGEVWRNLEPGGWVEFQEYHAPFLSDDGTMDRCPHFKLWNEEVINATRKAGTRLDAILTVPALLDQHGFVNKGSASTKWPVGPWAKGKREKRLGDLFAKDMLSGLEAVSMRLFTKVLGWKSEDVKTLIESAAADIESGRMHTYVPIDFLWAQKPIDATD